MDDPSLYAEGVVAGLDPGSGVAVQFREMNRHGRDRMFKIVEIRAGENCLPRQLLLREDDQTGLILAWNRPVLPASFKRESPSLLPSSFGWSTAGAARRARVQSLRSGYRRGLLPRST